MHWICTGQVPEMYHILQKHDPYPNMFALHKRGTRKIQERYQTGTSQRCTVPCAHFTREIQGRYKRGNREVPINELSQTAMACFENNIGAPILCFLNESHMTVSEMNCYEKQPWVDERGLTTRYPSSLPHRSLSQISQDPQPQFKI